jgi:hypothetical protein
MEATGRDADVVADSEFVTIWWKSLRGRLSSANGGLFEVIPLANLHEVHLIQPTKNVCGCMQFIVTNNRNNSNLALDENWISTLHEEGLHHTVLIDHHHLFNFISLHSHLNRQLNVLKSKKSANSFGLFGQTSYKEIGA